MKPHADDTIIRTIDIAAPPERVWRSLTDHRQFGAWFRVDLSAPFATGTVTQGVMTYPGHEGAPFAARTEIMDEPRRFVFAWPPGGIGDPEDQWTQVAFDLDPIPAGTRVTVTESGFDRLPADLRVKQMRDNTEGWRIQTGNLRAHAEG